MMTSTIKEPPVRRGGEKLPLKPLRTGGFSVRERSYRGIKFAIVQRPDGYLALVDRGPKEIPLSVTRPGDALYRHAGTAISVAKGTIKWHQKFGGWTIPKSPLPK
jgi:hypothetical protein